MPKKIQVGDSASMTKVITDNDVRTFAEISGDRNPVHLDDKFAASTPFGRRIAHGALTGALISAVLGLNPSDVSRHMNSSSKQGLVRYDGKSKCFALAGCERE